MLGALAVPVVGFGAAVLIFLQDPVDNGLALQRMAVEGAGLVPTTVTGPRGELTCFDGGTGPTWVFVHGYGDQAAGWSQAVLPLAADHRILLPDMAGHGDSLPTTGPLGIDDLVDGVVAVLDGLCPDEPVVLIGNSMGGWVSMKVALAHPDRVSRLVLVNSAGLAHRLDRELILPTTREGMQAKAQAVMGDAAPELPGFMLDALIAQHASPILDAIWTSITLDDYVDDDLAGLTVPADLLWGLGDPFFDQAYAEELAAAIPASRLTLLPGCAHAPQVACPETFRNALVDVLSQPPPEPRPVVPEAQVPAEISPG